MTKRDFIKITLNAQVNALNKNADDDEYLQGIAAGIEIALNLIEKVYSKQQ